MINNRNKLGKMLEVQVNFSNGAKTTHTLEWSESNHHLGLMVWIFVHIRKLVMEMLCKLFVWMRLKTKILFRVKIR